MRRWSTLARSEKWSKFVGSDFLKHIFFNAMALFRSADDACPSERRVVLDRGSYVFVTSPNFPENYPANVRCSWLFESAEEGGVVEIKINKIALQVDVLAMPWIFKWKTSRPQMALSYHSSTISPASPRTTLR